LENIITSLKCFEIIVLKNRDMQNRKLGNARHHKRQNEITSEQSTHVRLLFGSLWRKFKYHENNL